LVREIVVSGCYGWLAVAIAIPLDTHFIVSGLASSEKGVDAITSAEGINGENVKLVLFAFNTNGCFLDQVHFKLGLVSTEVGSQDSECLLFHR
jgi:hypothetical protein